MADPARIKNVAMRVAKHHGKGDQIVVVVSAMSGVTDNLIKMAKELMPLPSEREMDMLLATGEQTTIALTAIALHAVNVPAISLTGPQAGILTDGVHTKAKIKNITPKQVHALLDQGLRPQEIEISALGLEQAFIAITSEDDRANGGAASDTPGETK